MVVVVVVVMVAVIVVVVVVVVVAVVVMVRTCRYHCTSMHLVRVAEHLGRRDSRRPRHPFPALMTGVNPRPVPVHRALEAQPPSQLIDHTAPVVAYNGHATTSSEFNESNCGRELQYLHKRSHLPAIVWNAVRSASRPANQ